MWQVLLGIYILIALLVTVFLWSSLVVAKRADRSARKHVHPMIELTMEENSSAGRHAIGFPSVSELSEK